MEKENFKEGDTVYDCTQSDEQGKVVDALCCKYNGNYPITVDFGNVIIPYTLEGKRKDREVPTLSFTKYDLVNGGFSQDRDDRVIFTNSANETFTIKELREKEIYFVGKKSLLIIKGCADPIFSDKTCPIDAALKENEFYSEIFKTRVSAEKWIEEYKKKHLKLEDVYYVARTKTEKIEILRLLKDECIVNYFGIGKKYQCFSVTSNGKIDCLSIDSIANWRKEVDKDTFIDLLEKNNFII